MEKYRSTADPSTGIHPYLPQPLPRSISSMILAPFCFLIRLMMLTLTVVLTLALSPLLILPQSFVTRLLSRLYLFSLASTYTPPAPPRARSRGKNAPSPPRGSIIVANYSSPITILQLLAAYAPAFVVPDSTRLLRLSGIRLFSFASNGKMSASSPEVTVQTLVETRQTVVIFAEGMSTNGRAVLRFSPVAIAGIKAAMSSGKKVYAFGAIPRPAYAYWGVGKSFFGWMIGALGRWGGKSHACVTEVSDKELPELQKIVARCASIPALAIGAEGRGDFEKHWREAGGMGR